MSDDSGQPPQPPADEPGHWPQQAPGATPPPGEPGTPPPYPPAYPPSYPAAGGNNPYAGYAAPPAGWTPQPAVPGYPGYTLPDLPKATTAMVFGIVAVAGAFFCVLPIVLSPVAWILGAQARNEIRAAPLQWGGEGRATAGMVLGIVGTVLLVLGVAAIAILIAVALNSSSSFDGTGV
jgi:hypothetical protein